jgi:hypothetical protein
VLAVLNFWLVFHREKKERDRQRDRERKNAEKYVDWE